ncbi:MULTISPECIES: response regulator transcription factor [Burkholderia]|jgi:DNA-binding NarL/FixJ family response regulator|uniref:Bacterial regulatory s, luxR family protein n=1 Tax=Burkholderia gladioli TaxID=28095 RepID=A0A095W705_BURGA|nr:MULTISPECIES: response regulator transcription factor [Burkholderia]AJW94220.1 bacterial regulatory s, luxR family protein [Burkholderia gladioli]ASD84063.1 DNA-binding response regulator [Burkholderia gladioli pv. gladioli]AWY51486.1 DNA-binding response regulator [Burkholderia gladioli pv. gladioli]AYQ90806.1 DNA-binding response regulator [Burkholderia gladioli]KAF1058304.1 Transcriptional regulatory protein DegU [Burkholderia gladioli]
MTLLPPEPMVPGPLLIVDDEPLMQRRLTTILTSLGYSDDALLFAGSLSEARAIRATQPCAIALVDIGLPDGSGIELIREWHEADPALPIVVISTWSTGPTIVGALQAGATGYLLKERDDIEIALSIRSVLRGGAPIDPFVARHILETTVHAAPAAATPASAGLLPSRNGAPPVRLSRREIEILGIVSKGLTNREISELLSLSRLTVECHIKNIYKKLAVRSRTQAVFEARAHGLLP